MSLNKPKHIKFTRLRIIKNLTIICLTFALLFTAYDGLSMLQSTMNGKQGMGSYSQALIYTVFAVSSLLFPNYLIKKLGCKINLFVGTILYLPFIASNAYPTWATMMTSSVLIGFGASILWAAQCTYFNEAADLYCNLLFDCVKTPPKDCKLGVKISELLVIQDGISEKLISEMKSMERYTQLYGAIETGTDSKFNSIKIIPEHNSEVKTLVINTKIGSGINVVIDEKSEKNNCTIENTLNHLKSIEHKQSNSVTDSESKFESPISNSEQCITKEYTNKQVSKIKTSNKNSLVYTNDANINMRPPIVENMSGNNNTSRSSSIESVTARFFGSFGLMYCTAQVWSNLISYFVLNISDDANRTHSSNYSCGAGFCNSEFESSSSAVDEVPLETRYLLIGITLTLSTTASLLLLIFLDPLNTDGEAVTFSLSHVTATFNHLRKKEQICMVPLSMFSGMLQGFFTADFTKSYIQCAWSISHVGLVAVFYGLTSGVSCSMFGWMVKYMGRIPVVLLGLALHLGISVFLLLWNPDSEYPAMFYLGAGLLGTVVGLFYSQIQAFYGLLFKNDEETAFATHYFCSAMGWTISFIYSDYFCTSIKIYILMIVSCVGILGYLAADRSYHSRTI